MTTPFKYAAYRLPNGLERIGSLDIDNGEIQPLSYASGTPLNNLYEVIEVGEANIIASGDKFALSSVKLLAPISGRDILAVGKNYAEHAVEFNSSGYDSSDKTDQPTHPVIFTKRATSIIAHGDEIFEHRGFTETLDYEGEFGVIMGKAGFRIEEKDAMDYVWGYTIINDVTARERQRDHKQFYIGKSPDTSCPMGPVAIPKERLADVFAVQTHVNGELRQNSTTKDLIFSVPFLIKTCSEGITMLPGDKPPVWLKLGDQVDISITGLGTLSNKISASSTNPTIAKVSSLSHVAEANKNKSVNGTVSLTKINSKQLFVAHEGETSKPPIFFVHGLGGTSEFYRPLISALSLDKTNSLWLSDLEGHGNSPTKATSILSIESFAEDLSGVFQHAGISSGATLIAHSMGCLVAMQFILQHPGVVSKLILLGPPPNPLSKAGSKGALARAALVREQGMGAVVDAVVTARTSEKSKKQNPLAIAAVRLSLLSQDPECYAKACSALGNATSALEIGKIEPNTLIVTGSEDKVSPPQVCDGYAKRLPHGHVHVLYQVGHWHVFKDLQGVANAVGGSLREAVNGFK